jgi:hypothetical protein
MKSSRSVGLAQTMYAATSCAVAASFLVRRIVIVVTVLLAICMDVSSLDAIQVTETFDDDPVARGWAGVSNRTSPQDYGFSTGDVTGSVINPPGGTATGGGEIGGSVQRAFSPPNFYGVHLGGSLDPVTDPFFVSGVLNVHRDGGSGVFFGYSNGAASYGTNGDAVNFLGVQFDDGVFPIPISFTPGQGRERNTSWSGNLVDDVTVPFSMDYDPTANGGSGALVVEVDGESHTLNTDSSSLAPYSHFGMFAVSANGAASTFLVDDLTYTTVGSPVIPTDFTWASTGAGDWNVGTNWDLGAPGTNKQTAIFGGSIGQSSTVFTEQNITVEGVQFENSNSYGIAGSSGVALSLESDAGNASVNVVQGSHEFQLPINLASDTDVDVAAGSTLIFQNALNLNGNNLNQSNGGTVNINNKLHAGGGAVNVASGTLGGGGTVGGNVSNTGGTVGPGNSPGILTIDGNYTQSAGGTLALEIGGLVPGEEHDKLVVTGTATLAGTLDVSLISGFTLAGDMQFDVLDFNSVVNDFSTFNLPSGLVWDVSDGTLCFGNCTGGLTDYDNNGTWGLGDLNLVLFNWNEDGAILPATWINSRPPGGTLVGLPELNQVLFSWGQPGSLVAVPEPASALLASICLIGLLGFGQRQKLQQVTRQFCALAVLGGTLLGGTQFASAQTFLKVEDFDAAPAGWTGLNNRNIRHDFGFSGPPNVPGLTNNAGGTNPGEIGGFVATLNDIFPAYYADDIGSLDPQSDVLFMSGKGKSVSGSGFKFFGWFDKDGSLSPHTNLDESKNFVDFIGITTDDDRLKLYANNQIEEIAPRPGRAAPFAFSVSYDPNANGGLGALTGSINGGATATLNLEAGDKAAYTNSFDSFGILADQNLSAGDRDTEFYWDDMIYTTSIAQPPLTQFEWAGNKSGNAASGSNWSPALVPNSNLDTAVFGSVIDQSRLVFTDTDLTMKTIEFDNANAYVLAGQGSINLEADSGNASLVVVQGSHEFQVPLALGSDLDVTVPAGSTLTLNNGLDLNGFMLNKLDTGDLVINNILTLDGGMINGTVINNVPEPASAVLAALALALLAPGMLRPRRDFS